MKKIYLASLLLAALGSAHAALASTEVLGPVVAVKRVFNITADDCRATFKKTAYESTCTVQSTARHSVGDVKIPGGTQSFNYSRHRGGRDATQEVTFSTIANGYVMVFSNQGDGGISHPVDFEEAASLIEKVLEGVGPTATVYAYTIQ